MAGTRAELKVALSAATMAGLMVVKRVARKAASKADYSVVLSVG